MSFRTPTEITRPWPPNEANVLEPATWRLELLVAADNIRAARSFVILTFDGTWPDPEGPAVWEHFLVHGPFPEITQPPKDGAAPPERVSDGLGRDLVAAHPRDARDSNQRIPERR
jgi:hypothetical protein